MCRAESTCTGLLKYSPQSPSNCSRSCLFRSSASFLSARLLISLIFSTCSLFFFLVRLPLFSTSLVTPSTTPRFSHLSCLLYLSPAASSIFIFIIILPTLTSAFPPLSPVRLERRITEIPSRLSWIGYADVTDTAAPHKYTAYYLPLPADHVQGPAFISPPNQPSPLKYTEFMPHAGRNVRAAPFRFTCAGCHPRLSVCLLYWKVLLSTPRRSQLQLKQTRAARSIHSLHSLLFFSSFLPRSTFSFSARNTVFAQRQVLTGSWTFSQATSTCFVSSWALRGSPKETSTPFSTKVFVLRFA